MTLTTDSIDVHGALERGEYVTLTRDATNYYGDGTFPAGSVGYIDGTPDEQYSGWVMVSGNTFGAGRLMPMDALARVGPIATVLASLAWSMPTTTTTTDEDDLCGAACSDVEGTLAREQEDAAQTELARRVAEEQALMALHRWKTHAVRQAVDEERQRISDAVRSFDQGCEAGKREFLDHAELPPMAPPRYFISASVTFYVETDDFDTYDIARDIERGVGNYVDDIDSDGIEASISNWERADD